MLNWLKFEDLIVLQHSGLEVAEIALDFCHGQFDLSGLQMSNVDFAPVVELLQLSGQQIGAEVLGNHRQAVLAIGKSTLDNEVFQIVDPIDPPASDELSTPAVALVVAAFPFIARIPSRSGQ
ncbi:MAG: hypothetical protein U0989_05070 [Azonexus sp.]|nr:hypothetical protein [Azonexus sp.]MDZ4314122.1 hypothetical protein [Azonexus sp.]